VTQAAAYGFPTCD